MERIFYSITETADMLGENASTLRFWEKEFKQISPRKNKKGTRLYTKDDIDLLKTIQYLLRNQKLTIQGAKERLKHNQPKSIQTQKIAEKLQSIKSTILAIRKEIEQLPIDDTFEQK